MLTIYHSKGTRSLRVIWLCEELKLPYQVEIVPFTGEYRSSPEWRDMNPVGKVPVLADDDFIMFESGAMVQYILDRYGNGQLQPEAGTQEHGLFLQWCWFAESTFARPVGEIVNHRSVFEEHQQSETALAEMKTRATLCVKALDEALTDHEFLLGSSFSAADIMTGYSMFIFDKYASSTDHPHAYDYWNRLQKREACQTAFGQYA